MPVAGCQEGFTEVTNAFWDFLQGAVCPTEGSSVADVAAGANTARAIEVEGERGGERARKHIGIVAKGPARRKTASLHECTRTLFPVYPQQWHPCIFPKATDTPRANRRCVGFTKSPSLPKDTCHRKEKEINPKVRDTAS